MTIAMLVFAMLSIVIGIYVTERKYDNETEVL